MIERERENKIIGFIVKQKYRITILQFVSKFLIIYKIMDSFHNKKCLFNQLIHIRNKLKLDKFEFILQDTTSYC